MSETPPVEYRVRADTSSDRAERSGRFVLSRYLALSWTWCIGMFLPVLLIEDYGIWGWLAFAVPNIVGAAAMGWVVRDAGAAQRITEAHATACAAFSMMTAAFNLFFVVWFYHWLTADQHLRLVICLTAGATYAILMVALARRRIAYQAAQWAVSAVALAVCIWVARHGGLLAASSGLRPLKELPFIVPTFVLGFAACPYLDLTFHRVIRVLDGNHQRGVFATGFGTVFLVMILMTMFYAPVRSWPAWAIAIVGVRVICQAMWVAGRHINIVEPTIGSWRFVPLLVVPIMVALLSVGNDDFAGISGRTIYLSFLSMYALVFPAYVWITMLPRRGQSIAPPARGAMIAFALAVAAAGPFFWLGFFGHRVEFLLPGVAIIVISRYLAPPPRPRLAAAA